MSILVLDDELVIYLNKIRDNLPNISIDDRNIEFFYKSFLCLSYDEKAIMNKLGYAIQGLLNENGFALIKGFDFDPSIKRLVMIGMSFGNIFDDLTQQGSIVNSANPNLNQNLQGNQLNRLFLHTDFSMLENPPIATMIECKRLDPYEKGGRNGVATARDIVSLYDGTPELDLIFNTKMPFVAMNPNGGQEVIFDYVLKSDSTITKIRFHPSRIHYAFRFLKIDPSKEQLLALHYLQKMALSVRQEFHLNLGDIMIVNNHTALHDRTMCNLKMSASGELISRNSHILFIQDFNDATK